MNNKLLIVFASLLIVPVPALFFSFAPKGVEKEAIGRELSRIEKLVLAAADAMPEDRYYFTPEDLHIKGSLFTGVRTFAGQVKHLATDNYDMWCAITGDPIPAGIVDVNGPAEIKTKKDIMVYLQGSFAEGHKAMALLNNTNALDPIPFRGSNMARADLTYFALTHSCDHYGQLVVYLRLCGISPSPAR
ncbi:MAG: DinB family protein [Bacteroidota bacterium]|nr:DinB family protein [Bacteroidota bacterium]MDP4215082.1 DinB family protein [Bacteroidota bacterium]MDP4244602.1 DinB family protein [Bacteroidota bacterium]MDP4253736.1 DinB family protein [Bacteroidota bacterium]MDP4258015.1 DinB family protein [Bacteroidota bacterium]